MTGTTKIVWRGLQVAFFAVGVLIVAMLLFNPPLGLYLLWDVLIPVAPLLLVLAPGLWRNVCPLGSFSLLPAQLGLSRGRTISQAWQQRLLLGAIVLLLVIVPLRHVVLDVYGVVTGIVLLVVAAAAIGLGFVFDWKSAWCSGLCPVYPVEMLYGSRPLVSVPNVQCRVCTGCVSPCRDSSRALVPPDAAKGGSKLLVYLFAGGFPGFVLGWYLVSPNTSAPLLEQIGMAFLLPMAGLLASALLFLGLYLAFPRRRRWLALLFAALAVAIYYWFKLPVMLGLEGDGTHALLNLRAVLPGWSVWALRVGAGALLFGLMLGRKPSAGWSGRVASATA
ncbi:MAG: hypothetical protein K8I27_10605 [Planctomycetes bacterium]|nr:hypothetical protein [Planctomycetota bacterium]